MLRKLSIRGLSMGRARIGGENGLRKKKAVKSGGARGSKNLDWINNI